MMVSRIIIKGNSGKELVDKILKQTQSYVKTKEIVKRQYGIIIYLEGNELKD